MAWRKSPPSLVALFDRVLPQDARIERRRMFGYPAAFLNGKLFAGLHQESFILKLSEVDRDRLKSAYRAKTFEPMPGRSMRAYLVLPKRLLADAAALDSWLRRSMKYVAGLPATKKKVKTRAQSALTVQQLGRHIYRGGRLWKRKNLSGRG